MDAFNEVKKLLTTHDLDKLRKNLVKERKGFITGLRVKTYSFEMTLRNDDNAAGAVRVGDDLDDKAARAVRVGDEVDEDAAEGVGVGEGDLDTNAAGEASAYSSMATAENGNRTCRQG